MNDNKDNSIRDIQWNKMYQLAKVYYESNHNLDIPIEFTIKDNKENTIIPLGRWISTQRSNYKIGKMSIDRIDKLDSIGMIWDRKTVRDSFRRYEDYNDWDKIYELAKVYYINNGNLDDSEKIIIDGFRLDYWIQNQRHDYKKGVLSLDKIEKLESIGMIWKKDRKRRSKCYLQEIDMNDDTKSNNGNISKDEAWNIMYELAKAYYNYHGDLDISRKFEVEGYKGNDITRLGNWINNQKTKYRTGRLSMDKIEKLESIGMVWNRGRGRR